MRTWWKVLVTVFTMTIGLGAQVSNEEVGSFIARYKSKVISVIPVRGISAYHFEDGMRPKIILTCTFKSVRQATKQTYSGRSETYYGIELEATYQDKTYTWIAWGNIENRLPSVLTTICPGFLILGDVLKYSERTNLRIQAHEVWIGMTEEQGLLSIGEPNSIDEVIIKTRSMTQWVYRSNRADGATDSYNVMFLYFVNGKCIAFQKSK